MRSFFSLVFSLMMLCSMHFLQAQDAKPKLTPAPKPPAIQPTKPKTTPATTPKQTIPPSKTTASPTPAVPSSISATMVYVPGGTFWMGCSPGDGECLEHESPRHKVTLSPYYIGKYEVTQAEWRAVMGSNPSENSGCDACPVENVSWYDVQGFIKKLNQLTGRRYRLPTEAEWEYAARGGTTTKFHTGNCLSTSQANYDGNYPAEGCSKGQYRGKTLPVGSFSPNGYGLYDMSGNVYEWCSDRYVETYYSSSPLTDPQGPWSGEYRVVRGGSWSSYARRCRVSNRNKLTPADRDDNFGFRLARD
jgi:formylglycine-generating enzyme required for sulfatase activity